MLLKVARSCELSVSTAVVGGSHRLVPTISSILYVSGPILGKLCTRKSGLEAFICMKLSRLGYECHTNFNVSGP